MSEERIIPDAAAFASAASRATVLWTNTLQSLLVAAVVLWVLDIPRRLFGGAFSMPIPMFPFTSMQLKGSFVGSLAETKEMLEMVKQGAVDPIPVAERPLDQASATLDDLRNGRIVGRVVLRP